MADYLHNHSNFSALINIIAEENGIIPYLVEKDYWIMHVLYGLKQQDFQFELKGGTSLSKGYKIIDRFSEDIDIHIKPPENFNINENPKNSNPKNVQARKEFYDWLAQNIKIAGITSITRDHAFDDEIAYRSGGIRLKYQSTTSTAEGAKEGILLEAGFDKVTPNNNLTISSWAFDRAAATPGIEIIDNRAVDITCYHPGYTFVEKLQTIATKFRQERADGVERPNYLRQYYDVHCLLNNQVVLDFIGTDEYQVHKKDRFPPPDFAIPMAENEAFLINDSKLRDSIKARFQKTASLYYKGQPDFDAILNTIKSYIDKL